MRTFGHLILTAGLAASALAGAQSPAPDAAAGVLTAACGAQAAAAGIPSLLR